jgi:hypothetical protein
VIRLVKFGEFRKGMEGLFNMIKVLIYSTFYPTPQIIHVRHEGILNARRRVL